MPAIRRLRAGRVAGVFVSGGVSRVKHRADAVVLTFAGVEGDGHAGLTRLSDAREPAFKRRTELANLRQVSLVSVEELADISRLMGVTGIDPGWVAANIAIEGAGPITQLPTGTVIRFQPSGASVYITGLNSPCSLAGKLIGKGDGLSAGEVAQFVRHATGRRGVVGIVYAVGAVSLGDAVELIFTQPELPRE